MRFSHAKCKEDKIQPWQYIIPDNGMLNYNEYFDQII